LSELDPVTLAVIHNGLQQVCNEMDLAFVRAAFSPVISEALDRSDGIYHRETGELIAQGELGLPVFVGTMQFGTQEVIRRAKDLRPGDLFIVNDPYLGGTHLMDVRFAKPFFYRGELFCWLANTGHWPDTGGAVPGGFSANATEVEQEGLRLPPVKLFKEGKMDEEILSIILSNIRIADQRIGDIKAQAAALTVGERRLKLLLDRYGKDVVEGSIKELKKRAAQQMRAKITPIPDGVYEGESFVDSDGVVDEPLRIAMKITKKGAKLTFDMSGSSKPCLGPMNSVIATTKSSIYLAIKHIFPEVPINAGTFEPLEIIEPEGTFLYAKYPRPVSGCAAEVSQRIAEAVFAALVKAVPERLFAAPAGTSDLGRRLWRQFTWLGPLERLLDDRHLEDNAHRSRRATLSRALRRILPTRGLGRCRQIPRWFRSQLCGDAPRGQCPRFLCHGSRSLRATGRSRGS
jgi:N-methylhydantoinase B